MSACETCQIFRSNEGDACGWSGKPGGLALTRRALESTPLPASARILDIACGLCGAVDLLQSHSDAIPIGTDISFATLSGIRRRHPHLLVVQADAARLPFGQAVFDAAFVECALSILNTSRVFQECRRMLKPSGRLILNDIYIRNVDDDARACLSEARCLAGLMSQELIYSRLAENHFTVEAWEDHSELIKPWLAQKIFTFGSIDQFYRHLGWKDGEMDRFKASLKALRLGYYLLSAERAG